MEQFSRRVGSVEPSATLKISDLAGKLEEEGNDVVDLSVGEPDFTTPEHIREEAKASLDKGETHYTPSNGYSGLREAIAHKLRRENELDIDREEVIVTPGAKQALFESIISLVDDKEEVVLLDPSWVSYQAMIKIAGGEPMRATLDPSTGFTPGDADIKEVVSSDTKAIIVNTPSNPTGAVFSKKDLEEIRDLAVDNDIWVISDEIYEKIIYGEATHHSIGSMEGMSNRTITVNGFSKSYAMTGWRLGYYTAPQSLLNQSSKVHSHSVSCATSFAQRGGMAALDGSQEPVEEMREKFRDRRDLLLKELEKIGIDMPKPRGAFYAFIPVDTEDSQALCEELLEEQYVAAIPGHAFGVEGYIRVSYANSKDRIREGIQRMAGYI